MGATVKNLHFDCYNSGWKNYMTLLTNGRVGIGINNPTEYLTIKGSSTDTVSSLGLRNGNDNTATNNGAQIAFGYNGTDDYQHFIHTRHNSSDADNAIDFYTCDGTQNNTVTSGSIHTMSLVSGNVGIGLTNPSHKLHVIGDINISSGSKYKINGTNLQQSDIEGILALSAGGTGATDAAGARTAIGVDPAGTDNSTNVTLATVTGNYLSITGQEITAGTVPINLGGTGATTQTGAANNILPTVTTGHYLKYDGTNWVGSAVEATGGGSSLWSDITNTTINSIYYSSNVKIGGDIAVEPVAALEINGNLVVSGTIISGWNGSADSELESASSGLWSHIGDTEDIYYSSNVKIGGDEDIVPVAKLEVNGDIIATGDITAGYSDDRLKDYISNINDPINIVKSINGYYFKPNELANSFGYTNKEKEIGVSAQEVQKVLPEIVKLAPFDSTLNSEDDLVSKSGSNYLTVNYEKMAPLFIEAIKALSDKIDNMTVELNSLKEFKENILNKQK
jgi:hypothetical protein